MELRASRNDEENDKKRAKMRVWRICQFLLSLSGNLQAMESACVNYGITSALVLTMTFANFGSITRDDWNAYFIILLSNPSCQAMASHLANMTSPNDRGWKPVYCLRALQAILNDADFDLAGSDMSSCLPAIECAKSNMWYNELAFTVGNGGGSAMLLLVVLYTAWLYIALQASQANTTRYQETMLLILKLRGDFLLLHIMFFVSIVLAFFGLISVMIMKVTSYFLSVLAWAFTLLAATGAFYVLIRVAWTVHSVNKKVCNLRAETDLHKRHQILEKVSRRSQSANNFFERSTDNVLENASGHSQSTGKFVVEKASRLFQSVDKMLEEPHDRGLNEPHAVPPASDSASDATTKAKARGALEQTLSEPSAWLSLSA